MIQMKLGALTLNSELNTKSKLYESQNLFSPLGPSQGIISDICAFYIKAYS